MSMERGARLAQGLWQGAEDTWHLLRYLISIREVLLQEFIVRVIVIGLIWLNREERRIIHQFVSFTVQPIPFHQLIKLFT